MAGRYPLPYLSVKAVAVMLLLLGAAQASSKLMVFFFREVVVGAFSSKNYKANLTAEGHVFNEVDACSDQCTYEDLTTQVSMTVAQIRGIIKKNNATYKNGYTFIGHSQGATIARAVIEQMDEHNVTTFISLAGMQNGLFYGPQAADLAPLENLAQPMSGHDPDFDAQLLRLQLDRLQRQAPIGLGQRYCQQHQAER